MAVALIAEVEVPFLALSAAAAGVASKAHAEQVLVAAATANVSSVTLVLVVAVDAVLALSGVVIAHLAALDQVFAPMDDDFLLRFALTVLDLNRLFDERVAVLPDLDAFDILIGI